MKQPFRNTKLRRKNRTNQRKQTTLQNQSEADLEKNDQNCFMECLPWADTKETGNFEKNSRRKNRHLLSTRDRN